MELRSTAFPDSGIYILRHDNIYLVVSASTTGVKGLGPHKHNDSLSFEFCIGNQPIIVDPGTYCYTGNPEQRFTFRSTRAHNTIMVDNLEQNDLNGSMFALAKNQVHPKVILWKTTKDYDLLDIKHNGYERLPNPVIHRRIFELNHRRRALIIKDIITGKGKHDLAYYLHFSPGLALKLTVADKSSATISVKGHEFHFHATAPFVAITEEGWVSYRYNVKEPSMMVVIKMNRVSLPLEMSLDFQR